MKQFIVVALSVALILCIMPVAHASDETSNNPINICYPQTYRITYQIHGDDGILTNVTRAIDAQGVQYIDGAAGEFVFQPENGGYRLLGEADSKLYSPEYLDTLCEQWLQCARTALLCLVKKPLYVGSEEIVGRACDIYQVPINIIFYSYTMQVWVDQETGICLKFVEVSDLKGVEAWQRTKFECLDFCTEGIQIPS